MRLGRAMGFYPVLTSVGGLLVLAALPGCEPSSVCCINREKGEIAWGVFEECPPPFEQTDDHVCRSAWRAPR